MISIACERIHPWLLPCRCATIKVRLESDEPKGRTRGVTFDTQLMCSCAESSALQVCDYQSKSGDQ